MLKFNKRDLTVALLVLGVGLGGSFSAAFSQQEKTPPTKTYTYKTVGDLAIKADVYMVEDDKTHPVVVWVHGGALITGGREGVGEWFKTELNKAGCHVVSIDYRLAPETKLPAIIEDLEDAFNWVREKGPELSLWTITGKRPIEIEKAVLGDILRCNRVTEILVRDSKNCLLMSSHKDIEGALQTRSSEQDKLVVRLGIQALLRAALRQATPRFE